MLRTLAQASTDRLTPMIRLLRKTIGQTTAHGALRMMPRASEIIWPQSGVGGATPIPRNDSELTARKIHDHCIAP